MGIAAQVTSQGVVLRTSARAKFWNRIDPVYFLLDRILFATFFSPRLPGIDAPPTTIEVPEIVFLLDNLRKHRLIMWANGLALAAIISTGLLRLDQSDLLSLLPGLAAPVIVSGIGWYTISFSGVPERFGRHAMLVTGVLFLAVSLSLTTLFLVLLTVTPLAVATTVLAPIYLALYIAAILYDNLDGLRAAASQEAAVFSRAQAYLPRASYGDIEVPRTRPTATASLPPTESSDSETFQELTSRLERLLKDLAQRQEPIIANVLIADCLNGVARLLTMTSQPTTLDDEFLQLIAHAHEVSVTEMNERAAYYLRIIVERVHATLGDQIAEETSGMVDRLRRIETIRSKMKGEGFDHVSEKRSQELADFLFVEVFRQLVSVLRANRSRLL